MTSPSFILCDDLRQAILNARVDAVHFVPTTGLLVLSLFNEHKLLLGLAFGPVASGVGLLPRLPLGRSPLDQPLVAALRAHVVGLYLLEIHHENDALHLVASPAHVAEHANHVSEPLTQSLIHLTVHPTRQGFAHLVTPDGSSVRWPPNILGPPTNSLGPPTNPDSLPNDPLLVRPHRGRTNERSRTLPGAGPGARSPGWVRATPGSATPGSATPGSATPGSATPGSATPGQTSPSVTLDEAGPSVLSTSDSYVLKTLYRELCAAVRKKRERLKRRAAAVRSDLVRLDDVPRLQKIGALLVAQGKTIPRGARQAKLVDWETNEAIVVDIAPDKPAKDQAAEFFQKARRLQRGAEIMHKRLADTEEQISALEPLEMALRAAPLDWDVLQSFTERMVAAGVRPHLATPVLRTKQVIPDERKPYHEFRSTNNQLIWVGRSGPDNDDLVTRIARPHHLWLHAKNVAGAHVIVPLDKNRSCLAEVLVDAATLAAHFSDARHEAASEVSYTERRYVRKPKKSPPGAVVTQREKVILLRVEKERLSRLLGSKVET